MFEGDLNEGELEIGQVSGLIDDILPVETIIKNIISEYSEGLADLKGFVSF
jgi:enoyl-[acyl-carrier protein] reductase II